ncbi:MAG: hypothetical protein Ta2B_18970 [Termitinemataceae bacterium]|nr:MAG: hypothetical protein Ta2B_18970 [Termitinemataceae bacterium]
MITNAIFIVEGISKDQIGFLMPSNFPFSNGKFFHPNSGKCSAFSREIHLKTEVFRCGIESMYYDDK